MTSTQNELDANIATKGDETTYTKNACQKILEQYQTLDVNDKNFTDDCQLCGLLKAATEATTDYDKNKFHLKLKKLIKKRNLQDEDLFKEYLQEFEPFHYRLSFDESKCWYDEYGNYHRETKTDGLTLPAIIFKSGAKQWCSHGRAHRTDKAMVSGRLETLPAYIGVNGLIKWEQNGTLFRDDVDEYGNLLPTKIADGCQYWVEKGANHRAELGKNPADKDFGKALPAQISSSGSRYWFFMGKSTTQDHLTKQLKPLTSVQVLIKHFEGLDNKNYKMLDMLIKVKDADSDASKNKYHMKFLKFLRKKKMENDELFKQYLEEYEEYSYRVCHLGGKHWENAAGRWHRATQKNGQTLPAVIYNDGDTRWYQNGKLHREDRDVDGKLLPCHVFNNLKKWRVNGVPFRDDVDEFGNLLPTEITQCGTKIWQLTDGVPHRAELGKDGKALPAIIHANGVREWHYDGVEITQDKLTQILGGNCIEQIDCTKFKKLTLKMKDGSAIEIASDNLTVCVFES